MKCPKCKSNNKTNSQFCENCGVELKTDLRSALDKEILDIIEINSFSKNLLAAYKARKIANKISQEKYGKKNYKEYVEMLMAKHFSKELEKAILGAKYARCRNSLFFILPVVFIFPIILLVKYRRKFNEIH
jgi:predicted amidophosphoribosyltransferase